MNHIWNSDYREMKTMDMKDSLVISKEQSFASAAMHACSKIVDGRSHLLIIMDRRITFSLPEQRYRALLYCG